MSSKNSLPLQNKIVAFFFDVSFPYGILMGMGFATFGGKPKSMTSLEEFAFWFPMGLYLLFQLIQFFKSKRTLGGSLVEKMKLSWLVALILVPATSITSVIGGVMFSFLLMFLTLLVVRK